LYKRSQNTSGIVDARPFATVTWNVSNPQTYLDNVNQNTSLPNTSYYYSIANINQVGEGPNSNEVLGTMPSVSSYLLAGRNFTNSVGTIKSSGKMSIQDVSAFNGSNIIIHGAPIDILPTTFFYLGSNIDLVSP
jgi:hypothetical protein